MNDLTKNQRVVFAALTKADKALTAYDILDAVRASGIRAPVQVYRALEKLVETGHVHRIESLSAFVACSHGQEGHESGSATAFAICDSCGDVTEIPTTKSAKALEAVAPDKGFVMYRAVIELRGHCAPCAEKGE